MSLRKICDAFPKLAHVQSYVYTAGESKTMQYRLRMLRNYAFNAGANITPRL